MSLRDRRGVELKVGDVAVHSSSGRYGAYDVVRVAEIRKRVRVDRVDYLGARPFADEPREGVWLDASTLIVVDRLPHVEGRLNTPSPLVVGPGEERPTGEICGLCPDCRGADGYYETPCGAVHECVFCEAKRGL